MFFLEKNVRALGNNVVKKFYESLLIDFYLSRAADGT